MKSYIILRNNRESGPLTFNEVKALNLGPADLVWIEGESTSWRYPSEIPELEALVHDAAHLPSRAATIAQPKEPAPALANFTSIKSPATGNFHEPAGAIPGDDPYPAEAPEKKTWQTARQERNLSVLGANLFGIGVLVVGLGLGAFVFRNMLDHFGAQTMVATSQAVEIRSESLPESSTSYAAKTTEPALPGPANTDTMPINAEQTPAQLMPPAEKVKKQDIANEISPAMAVSKDSEQMAKTIAETGPAEIPVQTPVEEEEKELPPTEPLRPSSLAITANDYKVGMFGGISNLELSISNPTPLPVATAVVEVEFLKPNGNVVKSQTLTVENIPAGGTKKLLVPSSNRGVKLRYRVVQVSG